MLVRLVILLLGLLMLPASACRPTPKSVKLSTMNVAMTLEPGDVITMQIAGEEKLPTEYEVGVDGTITFPYIGKLQVAGLEKQQIEDKVAAELVSGEYYTNPAVVITIKAFKSKYVTVAGEVKKPNSFVYIPGMTLSAAIAKAGGMTPLAISWEVRLVRKTTKGTEDAIVDYDAINSGEIKDVPLQPGDIITVARSPF